MFSVRKAAYSKHPGINLKITHFCRNLKSSPKEKKMKKIFTVLLLSLVFICQPAYGLELKDAKVRGLVGETTTGYLAPVKSANQAVKDLVSSINSKRKQHYQGIAKKNKTSLQAVEQLAGKKAIAKTPAGQYVNDGRGWRKK